MTERRSPDFFEDPFRREDREAQEREQRRREREQRRRKRSQPEPSPQQPPARQARSQPPSRPVRSQQPARQARPQPTSRPARSLPADREATSRSPAAARRPSAAEPPGSDPPPPPPRRPAPDAGAAARRFGGGISRRLRGPGGGMRWPAIAALVAALAVVWFLWALFQPFHGKGHGKVVVSVPKGASAGAVGDILDQRGVVSSSTLFQIRAKLAGKSGSIQPGAYTLAKDMSYGAALTALTKSPEVRQITVTIPEGLARPQVAPLVEQAGVNGDYEAASRSSPLLDPKHYGAKSADSLEGFLFPATYELKPGATANQLVSKQLRAFKQQIATVPMRYARSKNLTVYDVLTIASMVEREVMVAKERPLVAAVIYNRLRKGMPLGIDATTRFATGNYTQPLTESELGSNSPYNTRKFSGLPPGPIGNPGLASLRAAANPARVPYLFYVVKPGTCGEHTFATTDAEFQRAVDSYNAARARAGGKSPTDCPGSG